MNFGKAEKLGFVSIILQMSESGFTSKQRKTVIYGRVKHGKNRVSEWKGLYVQRTQKGYIWTRKAQKKEK